MSFQTANAELAGLLRAAHDADTPDNSVVRTIASATGAVTEVLYAKTADGAAGYSYVLLDGSFAEAAPATGDIITTVLAHGQLEDLKHRMNTAAAAAITPPGWTTPEIEGVLQRVAQGQHDQLHAPGPAAHGSEADDDLFL